MEINPDPNFSLNVSDRFRDDPDLFDGAEAEGDSIAAMYDIEDSEPIDYDMDNQNDYESSFELD
jgi:hypothetical protein